MFVYTPFALSAKKPLPKSALPGCRLPGDLPLIAKIMQKMFQRYNFPLIEESNVYFPFLSTSVGVYCFL